MIDMEEERKLYPMKICALRDEYSWGVDEFRLADLGYRDSLVKDGWLAGNTMSEVMDMYMDRVVGDNVFEYYGRQFPVQVKLIRVKGRMPLRVHPDDELAAQRYDLLGREKMWYVVSAGKDARLFLGFSEETDAEQVYGSCMDNTVDKLLNVVTPHAGDHFHIKPGTVHAAEGDLVIAEVSESSPLDFLLCGWGQEVSAEEFDETLTLVDALDFIDYGRYEASECHHHHEELIHKLVRLPQFTASLVGLEDPLHIYTEQFDSFLVYTCISGAASVQIAIEGVTVSYAIEEGDTILIPSECPDFLLVPQAKGTKLLEAMVERRNDPDAYINPDAKPYLDDECDDDCDDNCGDDCNCGHHHHDILS